VRGRSGTLSLADKLPVGTDSQELSPWDRQVGGLRTSQWRWRSLLVSSVPGLLFTVLYATTVDRTIVPAGLVVMGVVGYAAVLAISLLGTIRLESQRQSFELLREQQIQRREQELRQYKKEMAKLRLVEVEAFYRGGDRHLRPLGSPAEAKPRYPRPPFPRSLDSEPQQSEEAT
jgi:hypothetical protein